MIVEIQVRNILYIHFNLAICRFTLDILHNLEIYYVYICMNKINKEMQSGKSVLLINMKIVLALFSN